jgi:uncharacterized protein DUF1737
MKNYITQLSLVIIAVVGLAFLMSYARPAGEEPKEYMVVQVKGTSPEKLEEVVKQKLAEGWRLQGGVSSYPFYAQAMVK